MWTSVRRGFVADEFIPDFLQQARIFKANGTGELYSDIFLVDMGNPSIGSWLVTDGFTPIPEPATLLLVGAGLAGAAGIRRRKGNAAG